jgi:hypothetical protein
VAFVRPHDVELLNGQAASPSAAQVRTIVAIGPTARIDLDYGGKPLEVVLDRNRLTSLNLSVGDWCAVRFHRIRVFAQTPALPAPTLVGTAESSVAGAVAPKITNGSGGNHATAISLPEVEQTPIAAPAPRVRAGANGRGSG